MNKKEVKIPCKQCISYAICRLKLMEYYEEYASFNMSEASRKSYAAWRMMTLECNILGQFFIKVPEYYTTYTLFEDIMQTISNEEIYEQ